MLYIVHCEPQFIVQKDLVLNLPNAQYYLDEGQALGLRKTEDGRLLIGEEEGDIIELDTKTTAKDLLESCQPANFELGLDEEGQSYIKTVLMEEKVSISDKISRIKLTESVPKTSTLVVSKIRELK